MGQWINIGRCWFRSYVLCCVTGSNLGSESERESEVTISSISTNDFYVDVDVDVGVGDNG